MEKDRVLRGRERETAMLGGLLRAAGDGRSGALVLRGEPGIGKTALIETAVTAAEECGFRVLRARGVEPESEIAFAGLQELFGSVVDRLDALPDRQREVLAGALSLGPPVRGDPLAAGVATLSLLAAVAEDEPVLAVLDDAHWLDVPSAEALAFAARRLHREGVVVLLAMRVSAPTDFDPVGLPALELEGLAEDAARDVLVDCLGTAATSAVLRTVAEVADGNPLALGELARMLTAAQRQGREPLMEPLAVGAGLERAFSNRLARLSEQTQGALLVAAVGGQDEPSAIVSALSGQGLSPAALEPAEAAGLITIRDGAVRFYHPLLRSVIYQRASSDRRRAAHAALAAVAETSPDRRAWHLAAASVGPDEHVAAALEEAASRAEARSGLSTAARTYARAAGLSVTADARCRRLFAAANLALTSGQIEWAAGIAEAGMPLAQTPSTRADFDHLTAAVERARGSAARARAMLWDGAKRAADHVPARGVIMLIDATLADYMRGDLAAAAASASRARELAASCSVALRSLTDSTGAMVARTRGELSAHEYLAVTARAPSVLELDLSGPGALAVEMVAHHALSEFESVGGGNTDDLEKAIAAARDRGALSLLPFLLGQAAYADWRDGNWTRGWSRAAESAELAAETGQQTFRSFALVTVAYIEAARGLEADCRAHSAEALQLAREYDIGSLEVYVSSVAGLLELTLGNVPEALEPLRRCSRQATNAGLGNPSLVPYEPDLVEVLWASGRHQDARTAADLLDGRAARTQSAWGLATARRCQGMLAHDDDFEHQFLTALTLHECVPSPFERARTELCFGERLRRARRRADARRYLSSALTVFEQFGAMPWAERARAELRATGSTARARSDPAAVNRLTAQELRVALVIADGATTREAAAHLFLSPKTIEAHLGRAYRKLGVHNRAQLAVRLSRRIEP